MRTCCLILTLAFAQLVAFAQPTDIDSLKGIRELKVVVGALRDNIDKLGLHKADIQTDVELKLRLAGITVNPGNLIELTVNAHCVCAPEGPICGYSIAVSLSQPVILLRDRDKGILSYGATWTHLGTGIIGVSRIPELRNAVKDHVDKFLNDYLTANPKK